MRAHTFLGIIVAALIILFAACTQTASHQPTDKVVLQLKWIHQAQFAGYYTAEEKGYYADENIEIEFLPGGPGIDYFEVLNNNEADFAVVRPEGIFFEREKGHPFIAIATIYRKNPFLFVSLADSGITKPQDFEGKIIALSGTEAEVQYRAMMRTLNLDPDSVDIVPFQFDYTPFINGEVDIMPAFAAGSLLDIQRSGVDLNMIWPEDYGVHWYSDTIATSEQMIDTNPDLVTRFLRATLRGHQYMIENPEEAAEISLKYADVQDLEIQIAMIRASIPLIHTGEDQIGWMQAEVWEQIQQDLLNDSDYSSQQPLEKIYTIDFLTNIYSDTP